MTKTYVLRKRYDYLIPALFCFFFGFLSLVLLVFLVLPCIGTLLLFVKSGVELDIAGKRAREVKTLFGGSWGEWISLEDVDKIHLTFHNEQSTTRAPMPIPGNGSNARTFDLVLIREENEERLFEFTQYPEARRVAQVLAQETGASLWDEFAEISRKASSRRRR